MVQYELMYLLTKQIGYNALIVAAANGHASAVSHLIQNGANVNYKNDVSFIHLFFD
jgi:ankyrin repeat protein